jgi:hypothetical protein
VTGSIVQATLLAHTTSFNNRKNQHLGETQQDIQQKILLAHFPSKHTVNIHSKLKLTPTHTEKSRKNHGYRERNQEKPMNIYVEFLDLGH